MNENPIESVVVSGSGPSGYTAAVYLARAGLSPVVLASSVEAGGALATTTEVENYPGFSTGIMGPEFMDQMREQAERFGARIVYDDATEVELTGAVETVRTINGVEYAVVGGGDSALEEAMFLTRFADSVTLVHRRDSLRGSRIMQERALANPKIRPYWNAQVIAVEGDDGLERLRLRDTTTGADAALDAAGLFIAIGHDPRSELVAGQIELDDDGYVNVAQPSTHTNLDGVFACGDLVDKRYRQAITAAGAGCAAALDAEHYLAASGLADPVEEQPAIIVNVRPRSLAVTR